MFSRIEARPPSSYAIHPIVGILQPTSQSARFDAGSVKMLPSYDGLDSGGDGTVPRASATPIELADQGREIYAPDQHGSLQNTAGPLTQLIGVLSARPTANLRGGLSGFGLQIDEIFGVDEPIMATVLGHLHRQRVDSDCGYESCRWRSARTAVVSTATDGSTAVAAAAAGVAGGRCRHRPTVTTAGRSPSSRHPAGGHVILL